MATTTTTTGLNVSGIKRIKDAIDTYRSKVQKVAADVGVKKTLIHKAIQGDATINNLALRLDDVEAQVRSLLKDMDLYTGYLDQLKGAYKSHDKGNDSFYKNNNTNN